MKLKDQKMHINNLKFKGTDRWTKQFNKCSDYWIKANDPSLTESEQKLNLDLWFEERQRLELGIY